MGVDLDVVGGRYHRRGILFRMTTRTSLHHSRFRHRAHIDTQHFDTELNAESADDETYALPDANINTVSDERRSRCAKGMC